MRILILLAVLTIPTRAEDVRRFSVCRQGAAEYSNYLRYDQAAELWRAGAAKGLPRCVQGLGILHDEGKGVPKDRAAAQKYFEEAFQLAIARPEDPEAQYSLGLQYQYGRAVKVDLDEARRRFMKASKLGYTQATYRIGKLYDTGEIPPLDHGLALEWIRKAASQGEVDAQFHLGILYELGLKVEKDYSESFKFYEAAAKQGLKEAESKVSVFYHDGLGVPRNIAKAFEWVSKSAEKGYASAQYRLGTMYFFGEGMAATDVALAYRWVLAAQKAGLSEALPTLNDFDSQLGSDLAKRGRECAARIAVSPPGAKAPDDCRISVPARTSATLIVHGRGQASMGAGSDFIPQERVLLPGGIQYADGLRWSVHSENGKTIEVSYKDQKGQVIYQESAEPAGFLPAAKRYLGVANYPMAYEYAGKALASAKQAKDPRAEAKAHRS